MTIWVRKILGIEKVSAKTDGIFSQLDSVEEMLKQPFRNFIIQKCSKKIYPNNASSMDDLLGKFIAEVALVIPDGSEIGMAGNYRNWQMMPVNVFKNPFGK